jgi:hypothetical protein
MEEEILKIFKNNVQGRMSGNNKIRRGAANYIIIVSCFSDLHLEEFFQMLFPPTFLWLQKLWWNSALKQDV